MICEEDNITLGVSETNVTMTAQPEPTLQVSVSDNASIGMTANDPVPVRFDVRDTVTLGGTSDYEDLENKPSINGHTLIGDSTTQDLGIDYIIDAGDVDMSDYDYDFWLYLEGQTESGIYKVHDTADDFDYFYKVEAVGNQIYQEWWYTEETPLYRVCRRGIVYDDEIEWDDSDEWLTVEQGYNSFAPRGHNHYIEETVSQNNIWTYLNGFDLSKQIGSYKITNTKNSTIYYVEFDYRAVNNQYKFYQQVISSADDEITVRIGTKSGNTITWGIWRTYDSTDQIDEWLSENYYTIEQVDDLLEGFAPNNMIPVLWADLVDLRDNAELTPGAYYRITDYNFITTKLGLMSGNHQFDIVLLAISESMLSESGYACRHAGDTYFEREITVGGIEWLYTLYVDDYAENYGDEPIDHADDIHSVDAFCDSDYMTHPDTGDDVPVLYKTNIEEYTIDEPDYDDAYFYEGTYDLDGDEYDMWSKYEQDPDTGDWVFKQQYALTPIVVEDGELVVSPIPETKLVPVNMNAWELKYCLDNDKDLFDWASTDGKGVIYYLKDEFGNEAPYDFKNVLFQRKNITSVSSNILSVFTQGENSRLGLPSNYAITTGNNNYYYYTFDTPYNAGNDSSLFGDSAYNIIKPYIMDGQRHINNIVLGIANNNNIGNNCYDLTLWGTVRENNLTYNCWNLLMVGVTQNTMTYVKSSTFFSLGATTFGSGCSRNIGSMLTNSEIGDSCNTSNFGTGNMGIKMGSGCANNTFGTYCYNNTFENGVSNCTFGNYCSYNIFEKSVQSITLPNYTRYCKFETAVSRVTFTTSGGSNSSYIQYVTVCKGISNLSVAPTRSRAYEQIYYKTGRTETAV